MTYSFRWQIWFITIALLGGLVSLTACASSLPTPTAAPPTATPPPSATPSPAPTLTHTPPPPTATPTLDNWDLVWGDEFDGPDGSGVDPAKWTHQTGGTGWGNAELEYYTDRVENAYIENPTGENGVLVIKAIKEKYERLNYTSARLITYGKYELTFGRVEARLQVPFGQGIWPAFWMLGVTGSWPRGGEIDIMENIGKEPNIIHGTIHGPGYSGAKGIGTAYALPADQRWADDYHLFAIEWEPSVIRWYVDHQLYQTLTPADIPAGTTWVYDHPFYLLLNVAVGGGWPGYPNSTTTFPQTLKVDFVRVYERPGGWPTLTPTLTPTP